MAQQTPTFANWNTPEQAPGVGTQVTFGPEPFFRNSKDQLLTGFRTAVDAQYPDGYLGTMSANRRQDKVLGTLSRMNARQYSRGVHKGERINTGDYFWPEEFGKYTGIQLEAAGLKFAPPGAEPVRLTNDGKVGPRGIPRSIDDGEQASQISPEMRSRLKSLAPRWR
jgi:hypothetical protein